MSIESIALAMYGNGCSLLPIMPGDKKPGTYRGFMTEDGDGPWFGLKDWQELCAIRATIYKTAAWGRMADLKGGGLGIACGYGGLVAIDIDEEALVEPLRRVLPSIMVAKRGRKGFTAFFHGEHPFDDHQWWAKKNYRAADTRGLLDFLAIGSQTVLPPSIHPDTGKPYEWVTDRTLLNTPVSELPAFTHEHRAKMENVLRAHGWEAPQPAQARGMHAKRPERTSVVEGVMPWHDDVNAVALANLPAWVPDLGLQKLRPNGVGYRAVATWRGSGSGRADAQRSANLSFHPTGIADFGSGETFTPTQVVAKAHGIPYGAAVAWLREKLGLPDEHLILLNAGKTKPPPPTYSDHAHSLAEATTELRGVLGEFEDQMKAGRVYRNQTRLKPALIHQKPPVWGVRIDAGGGKTHETTVRVREWRQRGWKLPYVVPRIDLADKAAARIATSDIEARVYRGREQDDPDAPGKTMCRDLDAAHAAIALGLSVRPAVCERRIDGKLARCQFADVCGYERQREASPDVWVVTSTMLLRERPDFIAEPDGLVCDEKFHDKTVGKTVVVDAMGLRLAKIKLESDRDEAFLFDMRAKLQAVADANGDGSLSRAAVEDNGVTIRAALKTAILEQRGVASDILRPDSRSGLRGKVEAHMGRNKLARDAALLWEQIALFLAFDRLHSGRITVADGTFVITPLLPVHPSWHAPMLVMDATIAPTNVLDAAVFGDEVHGVKSTVSLKADIAIKWPDHVWVRQIMGAPVSMGALGVGEGAKPKAEAKPRNNRDIIRFIRQQAAFAAPARIGVICYKELRERIAWQLPKDIRWMHFGATSGLNEFETVAGLIVIGRWWNAPASVEATASVFAGYPIKPLGEFYRTRTGGIRMTNGPAVPAIIEAHPDPFAEAVRRGITEDELEQALGRLRPHRRTEPCFLDIISNVVLPITVDEVATWGDIEAGPEADMMTGGVVLTNVSDVMSVFKMTEHQARGVGDFSNRYTYYRNHRLLPFRKFQYKKDGPGQKDCDGYYLPGVLPGGELALRAWLEENLRPVVSLKVERVRVKDSHYAQTRLASIWRASEDRFKIENANSTALHSIDAFFDDIDGQET